MAKVLIANLVGKEGGVTVYEWKLYYDTARVGKEMQYPITFEWQTYNYRRGDVDIRVTIGGRSVSGTVEMYKGGSAGWKTVDIGTITVTAKGGHSGTTIAGSYTCDNRSGSFDAIVLPGGAPSVSVYTNGAWTECSDISLYKANSSSWKELDTLSVYSGGAWKES